MAKRVKRRSRERRERFDFSTRHRFLEKFAQFVLCDDRSDIQEYVQPLVDNFKRLLDESVERLDVVRLRALAKTTKEAGGGPQQESRTDQQGDNSTEEEDRPAYTY